MSTRRHISQVFWDPTGKHPHFSESNFASFHSTIANEFLNMFELRLSAIAKEFLNKFELRLSANNHDCPPGFRDPIPQQFHFDCSTMPRKRSQEADRAATQEPSPSKGYLRVRPPRTIWRPADAEIDLIPSETAPFHLERQDTSRRRSLSNQGSSDQNFTVLKPQFGHPFLILASTKLYPNDPSENYSTLSIQQAHFANIEGSSHTRIHP